MNAKSERKKRKIARAVEAAARKGHEKAMRDFLIGACTWSFWWRCVLAFDIIFKKYKTLPEGKTK